MNQLTRHCLPGIVVLNETGAAADRGGLHRVRRRETAPQRSTESVSLTVDAGKDPSIRG